LFVVVAFVIEPGYAFAAAAKQAETEMVAREKVVLLI
jgi:hypothetical protein